MTSQSATEPGPSQRHPVRRRPTVAVVIVALFLVVQAALYILLGVVLVLAAVGISSGASNSQALVTGGSLATAGYELAFGGPFLGLGLIALAILIGFLMHRRKFLKPIFEVNAYANPDWNEIVFLAAIIRPPFFDPAAEPVVNYGAMGQVIGHEISHLFDDQGRLYDGDGLLHDWWTPDDAQQFEAEASRLLEQVGSYEPLPGKHVNGKLTLGESLADVAGIQVAYDAYRLSLQGKELPAVDGFTGDQRFFLGYAQAWRWKPREAYLDMLLQRDFHPPSTVRPQIVRNIDAWYAAFDVQPGDKLYLAPENRIEPW